MIRFLTDEDFKDAITYGLRLRLPSLDIVRVQDVGLRAYRDPMILEFAASENRIVLSHDVSTMGVHARNRLLAGAPMPGLFLIGQECPIGRAIEEIVVIAECSREDEWAGSIVRLPL